MKYWVIGPNLALLLLSSLSFSSHMHLIVTISSVLSYGAEIRLSTEGQRQLRIDRKSSCRRSDDFPSMRSDIVTMEVHDNRLSRSTIEDGSPRQPVITIDDRETALLSSSRLIPHWFTRGSRPLSAHPFFLIFVIVVIVRFLNFML